MRALVRKKWFWVAAIGGLIALALVSPSYSYVNVTNPDGTSATVQKTGFGPQTVRVRTGDATAEASSW